jgi:hypothetical protein
MGLHSPSMQMQVEVPTLPFQFTVH